MRRGACAAAIAILALATVVSGCSGGSSSASGDVAAAPSSTAAGSSKPSLTLLPVPKQPLSGTLTADLRQSSRDVALGRFQVWLTNGLEKPVTPSRIVYRDPQLSVPVEGQRLREIPSGSFRGFPLELVEPTCASDPGPPRLTVTYGARTLDVEVEDETSVVGRWSTRRCEELAVEEVAHLAWAGGFEVQGTGRDAVALFELVATPTGQPGGALTIDTVGGTPVFTAADGDYWTVDRTVRSDGPVVRLELPAQPARCDAHAFGDSGGPTAFLVNVHVRGRGAGQILVRMSPEVTAEAIAYAVRTCGIEE